METRKAMPRGSDCVPRKKVMTRTTTNNAESMEADIWAGLNTVCKQSYLSQSVVEDPVLFLQPQRQPCAGKGGKNPQDHKIEPGSYKKNQKPKII